jgi:hypothetical protein
MDKIIKAIPTTYKGIRFKSKTEARFAVALDKIPKVYDWSYEQEKVGEWLPDFFVWFEKRVDVCFYIELKPTKPTDEYMEWIGAQTKQIKHVDGVAIIPILLLADAVSVASIGHYTDSQSEMMARCLACCFMDYYSLIKDVVAHYRFDLQQG